MSDTDWKSVQRFGEEDEDEDDSEYSTQRRMSFTSVETSVLLELLQAKKEIIESKKVDFAMISKKNEAWEWIREEYNQNITVRPRTTRQLKKKWDNLKRYAKTEASLQRKTKYKTRVSKMSNKVFSIITPKESKPIDDELDFSGDDSTRLSDEPNNPAGSSKPPYEVTSSIKDTKDVSRKRAKVEDALSESSAFTDSNSVKAVDELQGSRMAHTHSYCPTNPPQSFLKYSSIYANLDRMLCKLPDSVVEDLNVQIVNLVYAEMKKIGKS